MKDFCEREFVIFDVETTGLSPALGDRIVEIAALKVKDQKAVARFHTLVDPERPISFEAFEVNRITPEMLLGAPKAREVLPDFLRFAGDATLVGHNINFDLGFLYHELDASGILYEQEFDKIDTIRLARRMMPRLGRYPLWRVAQALGVTTQQRHRAMADVEMTFEVFARLIKMAEQENRIKELLG